MSHSQACEWSTEPNRRCKCQCQGRLHGIAETRQRVLAEFLDTATRVGDQPAAKEEASP
jgi:hypothetical protein